MNQENTPDGSLAHNRSDRVRNLGFDPAHLTAEEQEELLVIEVLLSGANEEADQLLVPM